MKQFEVNRARKLDDVTEIPALASDKATGSYDMSAENDQTVLVNLPAKASGALTINLPNVRLARGKMYSIRVIAAGGASATAVIKDGAEAVYDLGDVTLDFLNEGGLFYSDGYRWYVVDSVTNLS